MRNACRRLLPTRIPHRFLGLIMLTLWSIGSAIAELGPVDPEEAYQALDIRVSSGAAPGYVNDHTCSYCHAEKYRSYQSVGMAKSFYRPSSRPAIEDFEHNQFFHAPSQRYYSLTRRNGDYWFRRWQLDDAGEPINELEIKVDWIIGSGSHVRTYLYQNPLGELYELPLAWYSQDGKWGMQPGFEKADHQGVRRQVRRECMFCHNAYPDVPEGSDRRFELHRFPEQLPEGTGCQRCHGPGDAHVRTLFSGNLDLEEIRSSIVNPGKLDPERRDDVCFECHMLPAVAIPPVRRFERADYSFRPGQDLADYTVIVDILEHGKDPGERFEINHHPYRLRQSRCYTESKGRLSCLSCHDPHRKIRPEQRAEHYRPKCLACHQSLQHPGLAQDAIADGIPPELDDCTRCHMPETRAQDVIEVTMTDHRIRVVDRPQELLAPRKKQDPDIEDVVFLQPERAPAGELGEIYRTLGIVRPLEGHSLQPLRHLLNLLRQRPVDSEVPYLDLVQGLLLRQEYAGALQVLESVHGRFGESPRSLEWSAVAMIGQGEISAAEERLLKVLESDPNQPEALFNLALIHYTRGELEAAEARLREALALRPWMSQGWYYLGKVNAEAGRPTLAVDGFRRALAIDPAHSRAYVEIARALGDLGKEEEARRYLLHGSRHAREPTRVRAALEAMAARAGAGASPEGKAGGDKAP